MGEGFWSKAAENILIHIRASPVKPSPSGPCIAEGAKGEGSKVGRRAPTHRVKELHDMVKGYRGGKMLKEPAIGPGVHQGLDGGGMY